LPSGTRFEIKRRFVFRHAYQRINHQVSCSRTVNNVLRTCRWTLEAFKSMVRLAESVRFQ
jgi:hypothetical protein